MRYYPAFLDLLEQPCLVIGQGQLADEKAAQLEQAGAHVLRSSHFNKTQAKQVLLIVAALENEKQAQEIKDFGDRNRIFVNVVDKTDYCSFIVPAIVDRGNLLIAISTSDLLEALAEIRPQVKKTFHTFEQRKDFYLKLIQKDLLQTIQTAGLIAVREKIQQELYKHTDLED